VVLTVTVTEDPTIQTFFPVVGAVVVVDVV